MQPRERPSMKIFFMEDLYLKMLDLLNAYIVFNNNFIISY